MSHISTNNDHKAAHRIAVISDTHNLLRPEVAEVIKTCDVVLHGGDISGPETLEKIRLACAKSTSSMAGGTASERVGGTASERVGGTASERVGGAGNFYVVRGNNDRDWAADIPYKLEVVIYGRKFFMTHKKRDIPEDVDADVVIYGHSHRYAQDYFDGTLYLNPGSCGPRRFNQAITMAVLTIPDLETGSSEGGGSKASPIVVERIDIPHEPAVSAKKSPIVRKEQVSADLIRDIGTDLRRHRTVAEIAAHRGVSRELADLIVRLYVTHPGVTPEQIMSKMGL